MKVVFFGTPEYVLPILSGIHKKFIGKAGKSPVVAVVTQSPKEVGRKRIVTYSPIDKWAHERNISVYYSANDLVDDQIEADFGILAAYGAILPKQVLKMFPNGILNIHPSLLPKFRGASPVQGTIVSGEKITGGTIIKLDEEMDHGPIISQFKDEVLDNDTIESLRNRLFERSKDVILELIEPYIGGKIKFKKQNHEQATYTKLIKKDFGFIEPVFINDAIDGKENETDWEIKFVKNLFLKPSAENISNFVRSLTPWPGAWTNITLREGNKKRIKILKAHTEENKLIVDEVQLEGKNPVSWSQFKAAYPEAEF